MGKQGSVQEWSIDIRTWIEAQPEGEDWFLWLMEDTIFKGVNADKLCEAYAVMAPDIGRIGLTKDIQNREHTVDSAGFVWAHPESRYRLSTQPSIWNRAYLLQYLLPGLTPWIFETQDPVNDGWHIVGLKDWPVEHNEGVRKSDPWDLDLNGLPAVDVEAILGIIVEQKKLTGV
jgi:hypothetical protein